MKQKIIVSGNAEGEVLASSEPISFFGGVNPKTGEIIDKGNSICGKSVKGKILVFPTGKGSTVGSYVIYRMKKENSAPAAIIVEEAEPIIVVGCVLAEIPLIQASVNFKTGDYIKIEKGNIRKV